MTFHLVGRLRELQLLDELWQAEQAQFLVLYGRRRVGKTTLLTHWLKTSGKRAFYWVAEPTSSKAQLRSFSHAVFNFANPQSPAPDNFSYASWEQAWQQVASLAEKERLAFFLDEFTYLLEVEPGMAGLLQNLWDHQLKQTQLFLTISGSHLGMMKREFLSYQAPLYGRANAQIYLQPLPFGAMQAYFPMYSAVERTHLHAIFGGIPAYWERIDQRKTLAQNIKSLLLTSNNIMQAEPRLLLQDFISEPHNYISILEAISRGARTPKEIETYTGLSNVHIPKYLGVLNSAGFVERRISIFDDPTTRAGRHHVIDPYLRFYYRFISTRQEQLALGVQEQAYREVEENMVDFVGSNTWEEICREWVQRAALHAGQLPFLPDRVGSAWNQEAQIDVAAVSRKEHAILLGECKWTTLPVERRVLQDLVEKADKIIPKVGKWTVTFMVFSRTGWAPSALAYADEINKSLPSGAGWKSKGMILRTLAQVEEDLAAWSQ
jgi:uncharacterized protein